ncbi:hypothetical protein ACHAXR_006646 [Thalassiosira sp. AJA248-18]
MDLLKAELERKRRAVADSSKGSGIDRNVKKKRYLTAADRRRLEEEEEDREEELRRERRRSRKKKKRSREDEEGEEDLTTLLTKKYDPAARKKKYETEAADAAAASGKNKNQEVEDGDHAAAAKENQPETVNGSSNTIPDSLQKLSPEEVTDTLRRFGLPIRLFGEQTKTTTTTDGGGGKDDSARLQRLFTAMQGREAAMMDETEQDEFLLAGENRTRNVFLEKDAHNDDEGGGHHDGKSSTKASSKSDATAAKGKGKTPTAALTEEELNDKPKRIYRYFKSLLRQWEEDLAQRPDAIKRTAAGKNETKTLKQCKDYIRPLFQLCKRRELEDGLQAHLFKIVTFCEQGEFVKAHDSYMDVAIGRAAWPIGVTMVGIHARSGRAKIESSNVAHVMNSESSRKYLTSVKRLMSYNQKIRPDVHPSKKVMNL